MCCGDRKAQRGGGILGKRCLSPARLTHGCALSQKISITGVTQLLSSSVPALMISTPGRASGAEVIVDPHSGQNCRCTSFPLSPRALYDDVERGPRFLLTIGAVADADENGLGVGRIAHFPAKATTLDLHPILLCSKGARPAGEANLTDDGVGPHVLSPVQG
jgi:hypothetical protein